SCMDLWYVCALRFWFRCFGELQINARSSFCLYSNSVEMRRGKSSPEEPRGCRTNNTPPGGILRIIELCYKDWLTLQPQAAVFVRTVLYSNINGNICTIIFLFSQLHPLPAFPVPCPYHRLYKPVTAPCLLRHSSE